MHQPQAFVLIANSTFCGFELPPCSFLPVHLPHLARAAMHANDTQVDVSARF
jgi:hypothetical protein